MTRNTVGSSYPVHGESPMENGHFGANISCETVSGRANEHLDIPSNHDVILAMLNGMPVARELSSYRANYQQPGRGMRRLATRALAGVTALGFLGSFTHGFIAGMEEEVKKVKAAAVTTELEIAPGQGVVTGIFSLPDELRCIGGYKSEIATKVDHTTKVMQLIDYNTSVSGRIKPMNIVCVTGKDAADRQYDQTTNTITIDLNDKSFKSYVFEESVVGGDQFNVTRNWPATNTAILDTLMKYFLDNGYLPKLGGYNGGVTENLEEFLKDVSRASAFKTASTECGNAVWPTFSGVLAEQIKKSEVNYYNKFNPAHRITTSNVVVNMPETINQTDQYADQYSAIDKLSKDTESGVRLSAASNGSCEPLDAATLKKLELNITGDREAK